MGLPVVLGHPPFGPFKFTSTPMAANTSRLHDIVFSGFRDRGFEEQIKSRGPRVTTSIRSKTTVILKAITPENIKHKAENAHEFKDAYQL